MTLRKTKSPSSPCLQHAAVPLLLVIVAVVRVTYVIITMRQALALLHQESLSFNTCDSRNSNKISRRAYREGVVIAVCQGCTTKHWIADNLGWSKFSGGFNNGETNIEEFLEARGETVNRVSKDVWELENLYYTSESQSGDEENLQ